MSLPEFTHPAEKTSRFIRTHGNLHFGCRFSGAGMKAFHEALRQKTKKSDIDVIMFLFGHARQACGDALKRRPFEISDHDICVFTCRELGIDHTQFEHNVALEPIDGFIEYVAIRCPEIFGVASDLQVVLQCDKLRKTWRRWIKAQCKQNGCQEASHLSCGKDKYGDPDFEAIAGHLRSRNADRDLMMREIDSSPDALAVKTTNKMLSRLAAAPDAGRDLVSRRRPVKVVKPAEERSK